MPFNVQPNGQSAMWISVSGLARSPSNYVKFGSTKIAELNNEPFGVTFVVPAESYESPGDKRITIFEAETGRTIDVGTFKVLPAN
jgi:hypothetical protein